MGEDGRLADGAVSRSLLEHDAAAPFGERLDQRAVVDVPSLDGWTDRARSHWSRRPTSSGPIVRRRSPPPTARPAPSPGAPLERPVVRERSSATSISSRDAVLVVAPVPPTGNRSLTVAGLAGSRRRPGLAPIGDDPPFWVRDPRRRRAHRPRPARRRRAESMEGRPMRDDAGQGERRRPAGAARASERRRSPPRRPREPGDRGRPVDRDRPRRRKRAAPRRCAGRSYSVARGSARVPVGGARAHRFPPRDDAGHVVPLRGTRRQGGVLDRSSRVRRRVRRALSTPRRAGESSTRCSGHSARCSR